MSKSRGNTINPDDYIKNYGSDILRMYLAFGFNYIDGGPWNDEGIKAMVRFADRVDRIVQKYSNVTQEPKTYGDNEKELDYALHNAIKEVRADYESFSFNTAVARIMELLNAIYKYDSLSEADQGFAKNVITEMIKLLAPLAPHACEEWFVMLGNKPSIFSQAFPEYDEAKLVKDEVEIAVQINGKVRATVMTPSKASQEQIKQIVFENPQVAKYIEGQTPKKVIVIPGRIVNIVL